MARQTRVATSVPLEAVRQFEKFEGIPLDVIAELFSRMELPVDLQASFWETAAAKDLKTQAGKVQILTKRDGTKEVTIFSKGGSSETFIVPDDLTDEQLEELKRAQGARLTVGVQYQLEANGKKPVNWVIVFPENLSGDSSEKQLF